MYNTPILDIYTSSTLLNVLFVFSMVDTTFGDVGFVMFMIDILSLVYDAISA